MKKGYLSYFQILTLIISIFSFAYLISGAFELVSAEGTEIVGLSCCEKTTNGAYCQYGLDEDCDPAFRAAPTECEYVDYCKKGCCYSSETGLCNKASPELLCDGEWTEDASCNIPKCQRGCCVIGRQSIFTTEKNCLVKSRFAGFEKDFRPEIGTELECLFLAEKDDEGACVQNYECDITTRESCVGAGKEFNKGKYCSELDTECMPHDHEECFEQSVYWFDSCGNREEVKEGCSIFDGTICSSVGTDYECKSIDCEVEIEGERVTKKNGESWCEYEGTIGQGRDPVGSTHIRHVCFMGEERIEPCQDYRNQICVQSDTEMEEGGVFTEAVCRINNWRVCLNYNTIEDKDDMQEKCNINPDCFLNNAYVDEFFNFPFCSPNYPPGFDLSTEDGGKSGETICSMGNQQCTVIYVKEISGHWDCVGNCDCLPDEGGSLFTTEMNDLCYSLGDCGAYINIEGDFTDDGYSGTRLADLPNSYLDSLREFANTIPGQKAQPGNWSSLFGSSTIAPGDAGDYSDYDNSDMMGNAIIGGALGAGGLYFMKASSVLGIGHAVGSTFQGLPIIGDIISAITFPVTNPSGLDVGVFAKFKDGTLVSTGGWNAIGAGAGAAAGAYLAMLWFGDDLPPNAATVVSIASSVLGTSAGMAGASASLSGTVAGGTSLAAGSSVATAATASTMTLSAGSTVSVTTAGVTTTTTATTAGTIVEIPAGSTAALSGGTATVGPGTTVGTTGAATAGTSGFATFLSAFIWAFIIAIIIIVILKLVGVGDTKEKVVTFSCMPWQAPTGGSNCDKCDDNGICTGYECQSLGQTCELINKGTEVQSCADNSPMDASSPKISPMMNFITPGYEYGNVNNNGFEVNEFGGECIPEFTKVYFGIETDKISQCKISSNPLERYDNMENYFGESNLYLTNHTTAIALPSIEAIRNEFNESLIDNSGELTYYVKCQSTNGAANEAAYGVRVCVKEGPDLTAPYITKVTPPSGSFVMYNGTTKDVTFWVNEPADCKWSYSGSAKYDEMENQMDCEQGIQSYNLDGLPCNTTLDISNSKKFYIRCRDKSENQNTMVESYVYELKETNTPLKIISIIPEDGSIVRESTEPATIDLEVLTSGGAEDGKATCYYKFAEDGLSMRFFETFSNNHKQVFSSILGGESQIWVECEDVAGNKASNSTRFTLYIDNEGPIITRVYYDGGLKIMTDEDSVCAYSLIDPKCGFDIENITENAHLMTGERTEHTADWQTEQNYYIKCMDDYGNQPGRCGLVVRPYDILE